VACNLSFDRIGMGRWLGWLREGGGGVTIVGDISLFGTQQRCSELSEAAPLCLGHVGRDLLAWLGMLGEGGHDRMS
jgi:hypothetical protein